MSHSELVCPTIYNAAPRLTISYQSVPPSKNDSFSPLKPVFPLSRSEWIYRTPKSLPIADSSPCHSGPSEGRYPSSLSRSRSNATEKSLTEVSENSFSSRSLLSAILHPRTRSDLPVPPLRPIPSESQLTFKPPELTPSTTNPKSIPMHSHIKTPSLSPAFDTSSLSHSPTSSRSDSPVTPISFSSTCRTGRRRSYDLPRHRHRRCSHSTEIPRTSTTPSKSILTRTASVSTRASSHTVNKSVKFATIPTVHYATRAYWDMDIDDTDSVDINIDSMDLDDDPFANYRSREGSMLEEDDNIQPHDPQPATPTSDRLKQNPRRIKRLVRLARKSVRLSHGNNTASERPVISSPYALGSYPTNAYHVVGADSSSSLISRPWTTSSLSFRRSSGAARSASSVVLPIKNGISCDSLRRSKTSGADSLRSVDSASSRTERFRTWLSRTVGWAQA